MNIPLSSESPLVDLTLEVKTKSGTYCAANVGITLVLYYARPMQELVATVENAIAAYFDFIPADAIKSILSSSGIWRPFSKQALSSTVRKLSAEGADYRSVHLSSGEPGNVGNYGVHFFGSRFNNLDVSPRETCLLVLEFPASVVCEGERQKYIQFVAAVANLEPFESGYSGYAFKHLFETWRDQTLPWVAQRAQRFLGVDISYDRFRRVARGRVVNPSWITLLGTEIVDALGGASALEKALSASAEIRSLNAGTMLVVGGAPPIGDINRGAPDLTALREVAMATKPARARMEIGFGSESFRRGWLNRFDP